MTIPLEIKGLPELAHQLGIPAGQWHELRIRIRRHVDGRVDVVVAPAVIKLSAEDVAAMHGPEQKGLLS